MRVDMTAILNGKSDRVDFDFLWDGAAQVFPEFDFIGDVAVRGEVTNRSGYMLLTLNADLKYRTVCARCLEEIERSLSLSLSKNVALPDSLNGEDDDYVLVEDSGIELHQCVQELLFLELPSRDLCKEDCRGLCVRCGKNLNHGECGCNRKEIDPRLAVLQKFLDNDK